MIDYRNFLKKTNSYDIDITSAINYLLELHYKNDCDFTMSKIEQMLVIYKLCCMKNDISCFDIYFSIKNKEFGFPILNRFDFTRYENNYIVDNDDIKETGSTFELSRAYKTTDINNYAKQLLKNIFETFKNITSDELKNMIEEIRATILCFKKEDFDSLYNKDVKEIFDNPFHRIVYGNNIACHFILNVNSNNNGLNYCEIDIDKMSKHLNERYLKLNFSDQLKVLDYVEDLFEKETTNVKQITKKTN